MSFKNALQLTLDLEGRSYTNNPLDKGGSTFWGLTQRTFDGYCHHRQLPLRHVVTLNPDEIAEVYRALFWNLPQDNEGRPICDLLPSPVAEVFFQLNASVGNDRATKLLQAALMVEPDGVVGPVSRASLAKADDPTKILYVTYHLLTAQLAHYATVQEPWDAKGLFNRVEKVSQWIRTNASSTATPSGSSSSSVPSPSGSRSGRVRSAS